LTCAQCIVRLVASTSASSFRARSTNATFAFGCQRPVIMFYKRKFRSGKAPLVRCNESKLNEAMTMMRLWLHQLLQTMLLLLHAGHSPALMVSTESTDCTGDLA
jgi:hypothetical protein